ncbi:MAG: Na+/H+ antiporter NhaA [Myxococcota bacterium]|nr:sodium:proton antiporter [Deltaproteobacteria bacterium]MCP4240953.1 Na+/H+ antiporter NhaA [bacterium]MDP6074958.1 Na+/H+ antiporter NhaA [Myxococcota bacterium]MDP6243108.1 Na+/H+ antiporter NhaA [Myxococcota bacterium]MDP7076283.1 Na+/H+ antiporter NhaA [Myxococcota bacterium]
MATSRNGLINVLQEFSIPLLAGVVVAIVSANLAPGWYHQTVDGKLFGDVSLLGHEITLHFLVNDIFMVFFFGIAAKEITEACLPGGDLNPPAKAVNPLLATLGGVIGPIGVFFGGLWLLFQAGVYQPTDDWNSLMRGWGVPTATDIALAWLVARAVFGRGHPAINFLLLVAVADDAIGLVIIAVFYGDPAHPAAPGFLLLVAAGMGVAYGLRRAGVKSWVPYIALGGPLAWLGFVLAHLHPAISLVSIVPFLPAPRRDVGLFKDQDEVDLMGEELAHDLHMEHSALHNFEHQLKLFVDFGLFFFAFANAGVAFEEVGPLTWLILASLVIGKTVGVTLFGWLAARLGFPLPDQMSMGTLLMAGFVAALGLTVALFIAGAAFTDPALLGEAKMGALLSGAVGLVALVIGRLAGFGRADPPDA